MEPEKEREFEKLEDEVQAWEPKRQLATVKELFGAFDNYPLSADGCKLKKIFLMALEKLEEEECQDVEK